MHASVCLALGLPAALGFGTMPSGMDGMADLSAICGVASDMSISEPMKYCSKTCVDTMDSMSDSDFVTPEAYTKRTAFCKEVLSGFCGVDEDMEISEPMKHCSADCKDMMDKAEADGHAFVTPEAYTKRTAFCKGVLSGFCGVADDMTISEPMKHCSADCKSMMDKADGDGHAFVTPEAYAMRTTYCVGVLSGFCGVAADMTISDLEKHCSDECMEMMVKAEADGHAFVTADAYTARDQACLPK